MEINDCGDGPLRNDLKSLIKKIIYLKIFLAGNKKNVFKYYYRSSIFYFPQFQKVWLSLIEAIKCGLPVNLKLLFVT